MNIKITTESILRMDNHDYDVEMIIPCQESEWTSEGDELIVLAGWGSRDILLSSELQEKVSSGEVQILK